MLNLLDFLQSNAKISYYVNLASTPQPQSQFV
jgi:hypothetical protein